MKNFIALNPNPLVQYLQKHPRDFTKEDIINYIEKNQIEMLNFRYVGGDGRLKCLNFVIQSKEHLLNLLSSGERVDGSSLFKYMKTGSSDLYVVPKFRTAFINPFTEIPTIEILCSYFNKDGDPLDKSAENIMTKAHKTLEEQTGYTLDVMGELEYYVISEKDSLFPAKDQRSYHESMPFAKWDFLRTEAMQAIAMVGGQIKYGHSEVGNFTDEKFNYEQNEIEFLPTRMDEAADQLIIAKWMIRMLGYKYGVNLSFAPKITVGKAGSGLHIHMKLKKDGKTATVENGVLSDAAKKAIAGILDISKSLTAFGNTVPTSYLRLVPHQEAPTNICWGDRNRSTLIRVPLGWTGKACNMVKRNNPLEDNAEKDFSNKQTYEFRCPDGSADIYLLLAGLAVGTRHGLQMDNALENAEKLYVGVNIFDDEHKEILNKLEQLPISCWESAEKLIKEKDEYIKYNVFPEEMIYDIADMLKSHDDDKLSERLYGKHDEIKKLVESHLHC
jgi:glutamine synthetase